MSDLISSLHANICRATAEHERARRRLRGIVETVVVGGFLILFVVIFGR